MACILAALSVLQTVGRGADEGNPNDLPAGASRRLGSAVLSAGSPITGMAVIPGGKQFAVACGDGIVIFDWETGRRIAQAPVPKKMSPFGKGVGGNVRPVPKVSRSTVLRSPHGSLAVAGDGKSLVLWQDDGQLARYDLPLTGADPTPLSDPPTNGTIRGVVSAPPAVSVFGLTDTGRLMVLPPERRGWMELKVPPVAGRKLSLDCGGGVVAFSGEDGRVRLWDAVEKRELDPIDAPAVSVLAVSGDGKSLVTVCGAAGPTRPPLKQVLTIADRKEQSRLVSRQVTDVAALSPDGSLCAMAFTATGTVELVDAKTGQPVHTLNAPREKVRCLSFLPDGTGLLAAGDTGFVHLWDVKTGKPRHPPTGHTAGVTCVQLAAGGGAVTTSEDGSVMVWDAAGREVRRFTTHDRAVAAAALSADGKTLFTGGRTTGGPVKAWEVATGKPLGERRSEAFPLGGQALSVSPDGKRLGAGGFTGRIDILAADSLKPIAALTREPKAGDPPAALGGAMALAFAADGRLVSRDGGQFVVWDLGKGTVTRTIPGTAPIMLRAHSLSANVARIWPGLAVSPDGKRFAAPYLADARDRLTRLGVWNVESGNLAESFELTKAAALTAVAYLPDGNTVAVGDMDGKVWLVDVATKAVPRVLDGHRGAVTCLAVSADGKTLASGSADTTAIIWNLVKP